MTWPNIPIALRIDLPAIILFLMLGLAGCVIWFAQRRTDFDFGNMLKDDAGKESAVRIGVLGSFAVSSWAVMQQALIATQPLDSGLFATYCITWSGALVFVKAADRWDGRLPWAGG